MLIITTPTVEGKRIVEHLGLVSGDAILGANITEDFLVNITDIVGGRAAAYGGGLSRAREVAIEEMRHNAMLLGANGVVGVDLDYQNIRGLMLMVSASGTAVIYTE